MITPKRSRHGFSIRLGVLCLLLLMTGSVALYYAWAAPATKNWNFTTASEYTVYKGDGTQDTDNEKIIVDGGVAKLVAQGADLIDDTVTKYNSGSYSSTVPGPDAIMQLTKTGSTFNTPGTYISRVFDGGTGNIWARLNYSASNIVNNMSGAVWHYVAGPGSNGEVIGLSAGRFDNYHVGQPCVIKDGSTYKMWYYANNYGVPTGTYGDMIGYATSADGINWTKVDGPGPGYAVIWADVAGRFDSGYITNTDYIYPGSVIKDGSTYKMWYCGYSPATPAKYRIGYATSSDGINWAKYDGPETLYSVLDTTAGRFDSGDVLYPWVIKDGSTYKMWYTAGDGSRDCIGYATSPDGINWTRVDGPGYKGSVIDGIQGTCDYSTVSQPCVIKDGETYKMWYTAYGGRRSSVNYNVAYATSPDGINWVPVDGKQIGGSCFPTYGETFQDNQIYRPSVMKDGDTYKMWYEVNLGREYIFYATGDADTTLPASVKFQVRSGTANPPTGDFVGPDGTVNSYYTGASSQVLTSTKFNITHRYVQYKAYIDGKSDGSASPAIDWVSFQGSKVTRADDTKDDFDKGTYSNTAALALEQASPYVGLSEMSGGGYNAYGTYTSRAFDGGDSAVWNSIAWTGGRKEIDPANERGLVALYHLNSNLNDSSGNGNNMTSAGGGISYSTTDAKMGSACFSNDGTSGYGLMPLSDTLKNFDAITITAWVKFDYGQDGGLVAGYQSSTTSPNYELWLAAAPLNLAGEIYDTQYNAHLSASYTYSNQIGYRQWHHVAMRWDGNTRQSSFTTFLDGVKMDTAYDWPWVGTNQFKFRTAKYPFHLGHFWWGQDYKFKGKIDEVAIYNRALSDKEIEDQYQDGADIKFQCRSGASLSELEAEAFTGPDGTASTFYSSPTATAFAGEVPDNRYFQYRAYFYGSVTSTPALRDVTVAYNTSSSFTDGSRADFDAGTYDGSNTKIYADEIKLSKVSNGGLCEIPSTTAGLKALYHMNEDWTDASGNANDGTPKNSPSFTRLAKLGSHAGLFRYNRSSYIDLGNIDLPGDCTVELWYKNMQENWSCMFYSDATSDGNTFQMYLYHHTNWGPYVSSKMTDGTTVSSVSNQYYYGRATDLGWHHIAAVRDDTAKTMTTYVDGRAYGTASYAGKTVVPSTSTGVDIVGRNGNAANYYYYGLIDEFALYNRALSPEEVAQHAGVGYATQGTNAFTSQTIDAGTTVNWSQILWGEKEAGYGEELPVTSTKVETAADIPDLEGLWHMNGDWTDASSTRGGKTQHDGTAAGNATFDAASPKIGSASGSFDGAVGTYVDIANVGSKIKSVEFWVKTSSADTGIIELKSGNVYVTLAGRAVTLTGFTNANIYVNGSSMQKYIGTGWNHVAVVQDMAISSPSMKIGKAGSSYLNGEMDEVAIYNRALTASEIKKHYFDGAGNYGICALWHFDGDFTDATGNGHDGTGNTGVEFVTPGKIGTHAASFNGNEGYVILPGGNWLPSYKEARTFEAWVKTSAEKKNNIFFYGLYATAGQHFFVDIDKVTGSGNSWPYTLTVGNYALVAGVGSAGSSSTIRAVDVQPVNDGAWHHVAVTMFCNPPDNNAIITLYLDGQRRSSGWLTTTWSTEPSQDCLIGEDSVASGRFKGQMDEMAIYNRVLTEEEILDHYQRGACNIKAQVSTNGGSTWTDATGTAGAYITATPSSLNISNTDTIKYKLLLSTTDGNYSPVFRGATLKKASYPTDNPYVIPNSGQVYIGYLNTFAGTPGVNNQGTIKYQISKDDGSTWYWWNGTTWASTSQGYLTSNTAADISTNIPGLYDQLGAGTFKFKAFLNSTGLQAAELDNAELSYAQGKITVTYPNGGETLLTGSYADITWTAAGTVGTTWNVEYSKAGAAGPWTTIVSGTTVTATDGVYTYRWNSIPSAAQTATARIRITDAADSTIHDMSNANFIIGTGFEIISPSGGQKVYANTADNTISWKSSGGMGSVVSLYYSTNGTDYTLITDAAPNQTGTNTYSLWDIADDASLYSETAKVKVSNDALGKSAVSPTVFTIAGIKFTAPVTGSLVRRGSDYDITWKSAGAGSTVKIEYSTNGGTGWTTIAANASNTGGTNTYEWTVDAAISANALMKITSNSDSNLTFTTGVFTFGDIQLTAPATGTVWQAAKSNATVTWTSAGVTGTVSLYYSTNGTDWTAIGTGLANDGSYTAAEGFVVPTALSDTVKFKLVADNDPTFASITGNFSIAGVKVSVPNGGEAFNMTSVNAISWTYNNAGEAAAFYYSLDGGSTWANIASAIYLNQNSYNWIPSGTAGVTPSVRARIKILAETPADDPEPANPYTAPMDDTSDANFTIAGLKTTAPALNASWLIGSTQGVQWLSAGTNSAAATVYYSVLGDFSDQVAIATDIANNEVYPGNNTYQWAIGSTITPSVTAKVKIVAGSFTATSPAFTLKGMRVTAPALNAVITQGVASNVTWSSAGVSGNVNILYSSDGGSNYSATPINASPVNVTAGTYSWTPNTLVYTPSANAKLKIQVVSGTDTGLSVESPVFTLKGIKISAPAAGATWAIGETQPITWSAAGSGSTCNIYYAADGTNFGDPINGASPVLLSAGTYSWTIGSSISPSSAAAKIKITSDTNVSSTSGAFTVNGIKVTSPTGSTIWEVGESVTVNWLDAGLGNGVHVYLVVDGAETLLTTYPKYDHTFTWTVTEAAVCPNAVIKLRGGASAQYTADSEPFKIVGEATVAVTSPAANDKWNVSDTNAITWTRSGSSEKSFLVEYDDNSSFASPETIGGTPAYDGAGHYTLNWSVPDSVGTRYIRITDLVNTNVTDISGAFKILPKFRVNTPNGGNTFYALKPGTTVNWGTTGTAGTVDLYYSADSPLYATWTKINTAAISDNGSGTTEAITSYSWTVANVQSAAVKFRVRAANTNLSDAYDDSDAVFTIKYYDVTWNVKSATTEDFLDKLFVIDTSGWAAADLTAPVAHSYPYGTYSTTWSRTDYLDKSNRNWTTTADSMSIEISMTESSLSPEYHVMSNFSYNASADKFLINSWVERGGFILSQPSSCTVHIYDAAGGPLQTLTAATSDANGVFWQEWPTTGLDQNAMYFAKVDIVYSGETYSSGLSYSLNIPKSIAGLGTTVATQLTNLQTAIGTDLATQTTEIKTKIDTLETSIGTNLDAKISTVKTDIAAVKAVVDNIEDKVGVIAGTDTQSLSEQVAQQLAAELAKGVQAEILTRPTSAAFDAATDIRFRTTTGMSPTITVYDANNVTRVAATAMKEVGSTGIYEYALTPQSAWGAGEYTVVCEEATKKAVDSMVLSVSESVASGGGGDEGMVNSINATVTTIDSNVKTMLSKVNTLPDDTTDVNTSVSSLMAAVGKTTDAAGTNSLFGKIASAQGDITAFKTDITSYVDGVETTLGTTADAAGANTVYGKIRSLEQTLSTLGPDGTKAGKQLLAAKDQAAAASKAAEDIKKMIAAGGKNAEAYSALQKLAGDLAKLQAANASIGSSLTADSITDFIRDTRAKLAQVAMKEGYENLVPSTGEVGQVNLTDEGEVGDLRNDVTELKALMSQVRSLLDKQVNAPVVKSWIEGK